MSDFDTDNVTVIDWDEARLTGNPYSVKPNKLMLTDNGYILRREVKTRYTKNGLDLSETSSFMVRYNASYVYSYVIKHVIEPLNLLTVKSAITLIRSVYHYKNDNQ